MNNVILDNQLQILLSSCPKQSKDLAIPLIASLVVKGDKASLKLVKEKLGTSLYNHYCLLLTDKIKDTM